MFPIKDYYLNAGVTEENFIEIAHKWVDEYMALKHEMQLRPFATEIIETFKSRDY
ncbi:MAG: hypothetical protein GYA87_09280, partial [Christensenellaceae bacterium]|nr:hypothetical protein [Christensenellaceae bacterium]